MSGGSIPIQGRRLDTLNWRTTMANKLLLTCIVVVVAGMNATAAERLSINPEVRPVRNIVFILIDDLGIKDLGCYGSDYYKTPNIDRLAAEGMRFTEAYSSHAVCSPARASILTGRYPARLHFTVHVPGNEPPTAKLRAPDWIKYLRYSEITYAEAFRESGFATFHVGKWHVNSEYAGVDSPGEHGFDFTVPGSPLYPKTVEDDHAVERYTAAIETFLTKHRDQPFVAVLSHDTVHVPLYAKPELTAKYRNKAPGANGQNNPVMAAMIERMDASVGRVLSKLEELGLHENTAVVFFSDNGGLSMVYDQELKKSVVATSNLPYRGGKSQFYEGGIRVPLIIKWPGVTAPGQSCLVPVISMDLYPTFLEMAGLPLKPAQHLDGLSLVPLLKGGEKLNRNTLYWHFPHYHSLPPHGAIRAGDWKLIESYETGKIELFNLKDDPGEKKNLATVLPERAGQLKSWLHDYLKTIGAQMPESNPRYHPSEPWTKNRGRGKIDLYENRQSEDLRTYVTDPLLDYGGTRK
jgi:arylsulfatase A